MDVSAAFLQSDNLDRDIFFDPPKELKKEGFIWKLKKPIYGLNDASKRFYNTMVKVLEKAKMKKASFDNAFFYKHDENGLLEGILLSHVDDFLIAGNNMFLKQIRLDLENRFDFGKYQDEVFTFTGVNIQQKKNEIEIDQKEYARSIDEIVYYKKNTGEVTPEEHKEYRGIVGKLLWLSELTRPDISYEVREVSTKNNNPTYNDINRVNKIVRKVKEDEKDIKFKYIGPLEDLEMISYSDASHTNTENKTKAVAGRVILLKGKSKDKYAMLHYKSATVKKVCKSIKSVETRALEMAMENAIAVAKSIEEIRTGKFCSKRIQKNMI